MPKVYYKARERMLVINGQEFPAEPIQAKRAMKAFGLKFGEMLDLYTGSVYSNGRVVRVNMAFIMPEALRRLVGSEEEE